MSLSEHVGSIVVPAPLRPYLGEALSRLRYLLPDAVIEPEGDRVVITAESPEATERAGRELHYALCRAKIRAEGESQRQVLFRMVFGS